MFVDILVLSEFVTSGGLHGVKIKAYELFASNISSALYKSLINNIIKMNYLLHLTSNCPYYVPHREFNSAVWSFSR